MKSSSYGINNIKKLFLSLLPVQIFVNLTSSLSGIVNGIVIGNYLSSLDMIALGFATPVTATIGAVSTIVSSGARILCGKFVGRGEKERINETFSLSIISLIIIGVVLGVGCFIFSDKVALLFGTSIEVLTRTSLYIKGISIGILPTIVSPCLMVFLQMQNESRYALVSTILLAALNLSLGLLMMKYFQTGIFGIGLVTSISQYLTMVFIICRFFVVKALPHLTRTRNITILKELFLLGIPSALANCLYAFRNTQLNIVASEVYGVEAVNALSILNSSCGPFDAFNIGVGSTYLMLASIYIGEKDKESLKALSKITLFYGMILAFIKVGIIFLTADKLAIFFGADELVCGLTVDLYHHYAIAMPINIILLVLINSHQAFGRIVLCTITYVFSAFIIPITTARLLGNVIGISGVWCCYWVAEILTIIPLYIYACIKHKKFVKNQEEIILADQAIAIGNNITISITTMQQAVDVAKKIQKYCLSEGIDKRRSMFSGLCCEEIVYNIIETGFKNNRNTKYIDIYVDVDDESKLVNIRIKNNIEKFNPYSKIETSNDQTVNIGLRMVSKLAKEMDYQNTFGLNVLSITL